ncbi:hypothetical protein TNCV_1062301 [Trichonephila clavipes]|nr:hypothetical protein TNCV_1062301 [Trichonephila clavipes]
MRIVARKISSSCPNKTTTIHDRYLVLHAEKAPYQSTRANKVYSNMRSGAVPKPVSVFKVPSARVENDQCPGSIPGYIQTEMILTPVSFSGVSRIPRLNNLRKEKPIHSKTFQRRFKTLRLDNLRRPNGLSPIDSHTPPMTYRGSR